MTLDDAIEFIVMKTELLVEHAVRAEEREFIGKWLQNYDQMWSHPRLSMQQLRSLDAELLERFLGNYATTPDAEAEIRRKLFARFKTTRLRKSDESVAKRVLKRGHIAALEEYYQVKEFVACVDNIDEIGEENYGILDSLLENYDGPGEEAPEPEPLPPITSSAQPSRRRPPPPFDLLLEPDEKLCPPDTPDETRDAFVRAKFALVMEHASPQLRETLQNQLKWGMEFTYGPHTPADQRAKRFEFSEHEAEFFAGYAVSGAQHRAIELELEKRFGFRRLGASAQARLARMLATNDGLDRENRMFIERFIYHYPHQTLFTRAEMKRAKELLKLPSPSNPPRPPTMTPRPKAPPDMSQLSVGATFAVKTDPRPHRVIAFDAFEVFYDVEWGGASGQTEENWTFGLNRSRCIYYRHATPLFLDGAKKLRVDQPSQEFLSLHRPDLPLRFGRSAQAQWLEQPYASRDEFIAYLERTDPSLLQLPPLNASRLVLVPRSPKGAFQRGVLVTAENGVSFPIAEILWHAHRLQRPFKRAGMDGIGCYRWGLEKKGVPSFSLSCFLESGSTMNWHANAPLAP